MAPAKKKLKKDEVEKKGKKDESGDQIKEVKEHTKKAISSMEEKFQKQLDEIKQLLVDSKQPGGQDEKKETEEEEKQRKEAEEKQRKEAEENAKKRPFDGNDAPSTSTDVTAQDDDDHVGKLLSAVLGVKQGKKSCNNSTVYQPYLIRGTTLDKKLKLKIWSGEYVELAQLITKTDHSNSVNMSYTESTGTQISLAPVKSRPPSNFGEWFRQFNIFVCVYIQKFPEEGPSLISYMDKIYTLSLEKPLSYTWRLYDENFRKVRAAIPEESRFEDMPWHITCEALLREARVPSNTTKPSQFSNFRPQNNQNNQNFQAQNQGQQKLCFDYNNRAKGCNRQQCRFAHRCRKCNKANHPVYLCRANVQPPAAAGSAANTAT